MLFQFPLVAGSKLRIDRNTVIVADERLVRGNAGTFYLVLSFNMGDIKAQSGRWSGFRSHAI